MEVDEDSELYYACEADEAYRVDKTKNDESIDLILNKYFKKIAKYLKSGYFAVKKKKVLKSELTKICFEPADLISIGQLKKLYPKFQSLQAPPSFEVPEDDNHVNLINVWIKEDKSLYAGR